MAGWLTVRYMYLFNKTHAHIIISMSMFSMLIYIYDIFLGVFLSHIARCDSKPMPTQYLVFPLRCAAIIVVVRSVYINFIKQTDSKCKCIYTNTEEKTLVIENSVHTHKHRKMNAYTPYYFYRWCMPHRTILIEMYL